MYGQKYKSLFETSNAAPVPQGVNPGMQPVFDPVVNGTVIKDIGLPGDSRPLCGGSAGAPASVDEEALICVDPKESCEITVYETTTRLAANDNKRFVIQWEIVLLCMCFAIPLIFLFDIIQIFTASIVPPEDLRDVKTHAAKCCMQFVNLMLFAFAGAYMTRNTMRLALYGNLPFTITMFVTVVVIDQIRNIVMQCIIWFVLLRRGGQVPIMDEAEAFRDDPDDEPVFSPLLAARIWARDLVESRRFELSSYALLGVYAVFLLVHITIVEYVHCSVDETLEDIDTAILVVFAAEIAVRVLAHGMYYFFDPWNIMDISIVVASFVFKFIQKPACEQKPGESTTQVSLLRLLRLLRLVNGLRKLMQSKQQKTQTTNSGTGLQFSTPVDRVVDVLEECKSAKGVTPALNDDINWAKDIISSNKLYNISVGLASDRADGAGGKGRGTTDVHELDQEYADWLKYASEAGEKGATWKDNEMERFLLLQTKRKEHDEAVQAARERLVKEMRQALLTFDPDIPEVPRVLPSEKADEEEDELDALLSTTDPETLAKKKERDNMPDYITRLKDYVEAYMNRETRNWEFDVFAVNKWIGDRLLPIVMLQCVIHHELNAVFEMPLDSIVDYGLRVNRGYSEKNPFHNVTHAADTVQAIHTQMCWLNEAMKSVVGPQELLAGIFAAAMHDFEHPGVNNHFLVKSQHRLATRYNDFNVLENHHAASAFHSMMHMRQDPFCNLTDVQYVQARKMIIAMILATDMTEHLQLLAHFKRRIAQAKQRSGEGSELAAFNTEKQLLMNVLLHACDIGKATRPTQIYVQWMTRSMEEYFRQGDLEKDRGIVTNAMFDRDEANVYWVQLGYIDAFVLPLYTTLADLHPNVDTVCLEYLDRNRKHLGREYQRQNRDHVDELLNRDRANRRSMLPGRGSLMGGGDTKRKTMKGDKSKGKDGKEKREKTLDESKGGMKALFHAIRTGSPRAGGAGGKKKL